MNEFANGISSLNIALAGKASLNHTHSIADITGLRTELTAIAGDISALNIALAGKAAAKHTHAIADVTGLQAALDGKAAANHTHAFADITGKPTTLSGYGITDAYTKAQTDATFLKRATFDELFEKVTVDGVTMIRAKFALYSEDNVAAFGTPGNSAGSGGGAPGVTIDDIKAMGFAEQSWVTAQLGTYATQAWVNSQGFLKQHQSLAAYLTKTDAAATYQPKGDYALTSDLSAYVKKAGDTMTGALTLPRLNIVGTAASTAYFTADGESNAFINIGGHTMMVWNDVNKAIRPGNSYSNTYSLGTSAVRWSNVYATTINVTSTALVSNLNADMVDGYHVGSDASGKIPVWRNLGSYASHNNNVTGDTSNYQNFLKRITDSSPYASQLGGIHFLGTMVPNSQRLVVGSAYDKVNYKDGFPQYSYFLSLAYGGRVKTFGTQNGEYYEHDLAYTTDNVASATKLQTARTIWGQSFDGTANVSGTLSGVTDIKMSRYLFLLNSAATKGYYFECGSTGALGISIHANYVYQKSVAKFTDAGNMELTGSLKIGSATLSYDAATGCLKVDKPFYSEDNVAAFGTPGNSAGSGGSASGVTIDDIKAMGFAEQSWVTAQLGAYLTATAAASTYVKKAGDTMAGALCFGSANCKITNAGEQLVININSTNRIVAGANELRRSADVATFNLGNATYRWSNVYATTINVTSTALVSNLNADLLDGLHAADIVRSYGGGVLWSASETVADWAKRINTAPGIISSEGWAWANSASLTLGSYTIDRQRYSAIDFRRGNLNSTWQQKAYLFLPTYTDSTMIYIAQMSTSGTAGVVATGVKRYADYDTILNSKVAAATVADKVGTATVGSAALPVYINAGVPTACTAASVFSALSMNASKQLSVTVAGQTRALTLTYAQSSDMLNVIDSRTTNDTFDSMAVQSMGCSMKQNGAVGLPASNAYSAVMHIKPWKDTSAGCAHQLAFNSSNYWLYHRMLLPNDISDWARLAEFVNGRLYLDENRTVYLYYDSTTDCIRANKTIVSEGNIAAFG
ncbi:MAG: hypothetical protein HDS72_04425 [Bacteroidales bacterium]|nr:hypothetical protein [Bacteroidales bacterium]